MTEKPAVLLVDDEPDMLSSLVGLLRREFQLHTAESGEQALEIMAANEIHVLMTDQRMPGMTGSALLKRVCEQNIPTVLILFTGYADIKSVIDAVNTGRLYRYVTKPWDPDELTDLLRAAAAEHGRQAFDRLLRSEARQCASLGRDIAGQLRDAGKGADGVSLEPLVQACDRLEALCASSGNNRAGG